jgi:hypothetical protein
MPRGRPFKCPYEGCESTNTVSKGARTTKSMGVRKIRLCKGCGRKFTPKNQMTAQVEEIQTEATENEVTSVVASEDPVMADIEEPELTEVPIPEQ